jgi:hypothetical protein
MNKTFKILIVLLILTGCYKTENSLLEDVTNKKYKTYFCQAPCDLETADLDDAIAKAKIAGISEERILAAQEFGLLKAERELSKAREVREKLALKQIEEFKNKCALEEKVVCGDRCCSKEEYDKLYSATIPDPNEISFLERSGWKPRWTIQNEIPPITNNEDTSIAASDTETKESMSFKIPIKIKQGMEYGQARKLLIDSGWQAVNANRTPNGAPVCFLVATMQSFSFQDDVACKYNEIDACSGTGMGYCKMIFHDGNGGFLSVITSGGQPPDAVIDNWSKEASFEANVIPLDEISNYKN